MARPTDRPHRAAVVLAVLTMTDWSDATNWRWARRQLQLLSRRTYVDAEVRVLPDGTTVTPERLERRWKWIPALRIAVGGKTVHMPIRPFGQYRLKDGNDINHCRVLGDGEVMSLFDDSVGIDIEERAKEYEDDKASYFLRVHLPGNAEFRVSVID